MNVRLPPMKIANLFALNRHVSFEYSGSTDSGVYLLSQFVEKPGMRLKLDDGLIGKISTEKVEIWLHRPFSRNFLIPIFTGMFVNNAGKTELTGVFGFRKYTKLVFVLGMLGIIAFWISLAIRDHNLLRTQSQLMATLWICLGTLLFMVMWLFLCRPIANKDMKSIEEQIQKILSEGHI
jgi:hypothetical protein